MVNLASSCQFSSNDDKYEEAKNNEKQTDFAEAF